LIGSTYFCLFIQFLRRKTSCFSHFLLFVFSLLLFSLPSFHLFKLFSKCGGRFWSMNHVFAMRNMSFCSQRSKLSLTVITLHVIIVLLSNNTNFRHVPSFFKYLFDLPILLDDLLKIIRLLFPFRLISLSFILIFNTDCISFCSLDWRLLRWLLFDFLYFIWQSMLSHFKNRSLLLSFSANVFMFVYPIRSKFSPTLLARNSWILINFDWTLNVFILFSRGLPFLFFVLTVSWLSRRLMLLFKTSWD